MLGSHQRESPGPNGGTPPPIQRSGSADASAFFSTDPAELPSTENFRDRKCLRSDDSIPMIRYCRGKVEMSYFGPGSRCARLAFKSLPFPPPRSSCIAASRQGFPPAQRLAALTAPGRDATRTPQRREWQGSHWLEALGNRTLLCRKAGHFYFAPTTDDSIFGNSYRTLYNQACGNARRIGVLA